MKKALAILAIAALSASCAQDKCTVKGSIESYLDFNEGDFMIMVDNLTQQIDTAALASDGSFTFTCPASNETIKQIMLVDGGVPDTPSAVTLIPEAGNIKIDFKAPKVIQGGVLNDKFQAYNEAVTAIVNGYTSKARELSGNLTGAELEAAINEVADDAQSKLSELNMDTFNANKDNVIGLYALTDMAYDFATVADFDKALEGAADFIVNYEPFRNIRAGLEKMESTSVGRMFADFKGETANGKPVSLSDYVGKGKWVLADFWASWCGPCKEEIPRIIAVYKKYAGKDFTVVGIPISDEREDTDKALKDLGIKYDQIFVGHDSTPAEVYGISTIPHLILFAPDGTIAKRNLRGDSIEEAVKEALQK
ncbi:MAG: TlpA family protein disulfide reductase [Bacteroidales bacterium]|nr:TlpA family protein disulfide reductase [Bacteroidales bacterium]